MAKVSPSALREIEAALERYQQEVQSSGLAPSSVQTYLGHAVQFVRWLKGDFVPGSSLSA
jgi:hypothetical protein